MPDPTATRWVVQRFEAIDSTNRYVLEAARRGAQAGLVAVADHQSAGRGRLGRAWEATPGSALLVSVLLRPELPPDRLGVLTMAAGLALAEAVAQRTGIEPGLKWPNDLVVDDRKLAGLLAEVEIVGATVRAVVIGAGCNLGPDAFPPELVGLATVCELETGQPVDRDALLDAFLDRLGARLDALDQVPAAYRARSATIGRRVRVDLGTGEFVEGDAVAVSDSGALVVRDDMGQELSLSVGDVAHLRPVS